MWLSSIKIASIILIFVGGTLHVSQASEFSAFLHESLIRESTLERVMPAYPEAAVSGGIDAIVGIKLAIGDEGEVLRVKVNPKVPKPLQEATCVAAKKWRFKPNLGRYMGRPVLSRLTFRFVIRNGKGIVELYEPDATVPDRERLGYYDTPKELREWKDWEECPNK